MLASCGWMDGWKDVDVEILECVVVSFFKDKYSLLGLNKNA